MNPIPLANQSLGVGARLNSQAMQIMYKKKDYCNGTNDSLHKILYLIYYPFRRLYNHDINETTGIKGELRRQKELA